MYGAIEPFVKLVRWLEGRIKRVEGAAVFYRTGQVTDTDPLTVSIGGGELADVKSVSASALAVDDIVNCLVWGSDMLVLGRSGGSGGEIFTDPDAFHSASELDGPGLEVVGTEVGVKVDGSTVEISSDTVRVKDGGITPSKLSFDPATQTELDAVLAANDAMVFKGLKDCSANPNYPAADAGHTYRVSVAGKIGGGSGPNVEVGDLLICLTDGTAAGTHASVGANWSIAQTNIDGAVVGPSSATDNDLAVFNGTTGKILKDASKKSANVPSDGEKAALAGTDGTPASTNRFVTDSDPIRRPTELALPAAILMLQPSLYWKLGASGGLTDQSGNGRNGTGGGGVTIGGAASMTSDGGEATDFDGVDDRITSSYAPFATNSKLTLIAWVSLDLLSTTIALFSGPNSTSPDFQFIGSKPAIDVDASGVGADASWMKMSMPFQRSVMVAFTFDESAATANVEAFINGASGGKMDVSANYNTPGNFQVGRHGSSASRQLDGKLAHVAVFEKVLSPASIEWLYRIGAGHTKDWGLVANLPSGAIYGDQCTLIADATNGIYYDCVYDGQGSYPWKVIGGPPMFKRVVTDESTASGTYTTTGFTAQSITVPFGGEWLADAKCLSYNAGGAGLYTYMGIHKNGTLQSEGFQALATWSTIAHEILLACSAGDTVDLKWHSTSGGGAHFYNRMLKLTPVRLG